MPSTRGFIVRTSSIAGIAVGLALVCGPLAHADDEYHSPAEPVIRTVDRGYGMSGGGREVRPGTAIEDAHGIYVVAQGGNASAGAPLTVSNGNLMKLPSVGGHEQVLCTTGNQLGASKMMPC